MQKDIFTLIGKLPVIKKVKYTYRITLPMELSKWLLSLDGLEKGKRLDSPALLPNFILNEDCPIWILREFLKGLMGGDGYCPTFTKTDNKFSKLGFGQSRTHNNIESLKKYMNDIQNIFQKFDISSTVSHPRKNYTGNGYTVKLNINQDDLITFYEKIGFAYCAGKSYKLGVASSYYKLKRETKRQFNWVCERVKVLREHMSITKALKQAHLELTINEPIFNKHYSLPDIESINLNLTNPEYISASSCKFKKIHFPSVEDYLKLTESYDNFVTDNNIKSHSVKQDDTHTPCYYLSILHKKDIGKQTVYDIEVKDTHNFVANGAVVHNCIQDTELLQKLVDKQLILITIIQLANVTFVPIGFLTTRGQTIKVFSQLLRKARQMDFLVPHTNFNEDSYPIIVKTKDEHELDLENIGDYIQINCGRNKNSYGKLLSLNGKINEIVDSTTFIVLCNTELEAPEQFTAKCNYKGIEHKNVCLSNGEDLVDTSFTGATVLDATPGMYNENIAVLDFASLYPTIMISRNLCYSTFILDNNYMPQSEEEGIFEEEFEGNKIRYERIKWDDRIEYTLKHTCEGIGKSGKNKGVVCGKQAYFEVSKRHELNHLQKELQELKDSFEQLQDKDEIKKMKPKIRTKEKELTQFNQTVDLFNTDELDKIHYYCRVHDPIKSTRDESEKFQKKDVSYNYVVVQPHFEEIDGEKVKVNQGVLPALLEELYAERKKVKREMAKASEEGNKLLEDILNSTQLAIKVSLNSTYGFLGRGQGNLILKELGSIVTAVGRKLIQQSKNYAEGPFLDYIKEHNLLKQKIEYKKYDISKGDINIILEQYAVKNSSRIKIDEEIKEAKPKKVTRKKVLTIN